MAVCEVPLSVNRRPSKVRDGPILLGFGDGEEGEPGRADRKRRQAGAVSQPSFTQISAGRGGSRALSRPHVSAPRVPLARGSPTRNPGTRGPALSASRQSRAGAPPLFPPLPGSGSWSWAGQRTRDGRGLQRGGEKGTRVAGATGGRSSLCNRAGRQRPMRWRPRLLLNENKRSTWARLRSHVSPPATRAPWVSSWGPAPLSQLLKRRSLPPLRIPQ